MKNNENSDGRTIYIGNTLYSISSDMLSINELDGLKGIQTIDLECPELLRILSEPFIFGR